MNRLTHLDEHGAARMVDVSSKTITARTATAAARVLMKTETLALIESGAAKKGDVLATARIAGIMAAKRTHELIPLCHPLALTKVEVAFAIEAAAIAVTATAKVEAKTGVEMEALTACAIACLTIYDMCKSADRGMRVTDLRLVEKSGGASGDFRAV